MAEPVAPELEADLDEPKVSELEAFDPDKEFSSLVYQLDEERKTLERGSIPIFATPQELVDSRAKSLGRTTGEYEQELLESGFDIHDAVRVVGKGEGRGVGEAFFGIDTEKYLSDVRGNRDKIKSLLEQNSVRTSAAEEGRNRVIAELEKKAKKGEKLPVEVRGLLKDRSQVDPELDFVTTKEIDLSGSDKTNTLGLMNEGTATSLENFQKMTVPESVSLVAPLARDEEIARIIDVYGASEGGGMQYIDRRLNMLAKRRGLEVGSKRYNDFVSDIKNKQRALAELAGLKTAGLWTGPILLPAHYFGAKGRASLSGAMASTYGLVGADGQEGEEGLGRQLMRAWATPTIEVIGIAKTQNGARDRVIFRQASALRHTFDMIDGLQAGASGALRKLDRDLAEARKNGGPIFADDAASDYVKAIARGIGSRDDAYKLATELDVVQKDPKLRPLMTGLGIMASIGTPDVLDTAHLFARAGRVALGAPVGAVRKSRAKKFVRTLGLMEENATDLGRVDEIEDVARLIDRRYDRDYRRLNVENAQKLHELAPKDAKPAYMGEEAKALNEVLPRHNFTGKDKDGNALTLLDMEDRRPHTPPDVRARRARGEQTTDFSSMERKLASRKQEFDDLEKVLDSGDDRLLMPQFEKSNKTEIAKFLGFLDNLFPDADIPFSSSVGFKKEKRTRDAIFGEVLQDPTAFKIRLADKLNAAGAGSFTPAKKAAVNKAIDDFIAKATDWKKSEGAGARDKLRAAIQEGRKAVEALHEVRLFTNVILRQKIAKENGLKAVVKTPRLGRTALKIPQLTPMAVLYRQVLIKNGIDEDQANTLVTLFDLQARNWSRKNGGRPTQEWWTSRLLDDESKPQVEQAPPPAPPTATPPAPAPTPAPAPAPAPGAPPASKFATPPKPGAKFAGPPKPAAKFTGPPKPPSTLTPTPGSKAAPSPAPGPGSVATKEESLSEFYQGQMPKKETKGLMPYLAKKIETDANVSLETVKDIDLFEAGVWTKAAGAQTQQFCTILVDNTGKVLFINTGTLKAPSVTFPGVTGADATKDAVVISTENVGKVTGYTPDQIKIIGILPEQPELVTKKEIRKTGTQTHYYVGYVDTLPDGTPQIDPNDETLSFLFAEMDKLSAAGNSPTVDEALEDIAFFSNSLSDALTGGEADAVAKANKKLHELIAEKAAPAPKAPEDTTPAGGKFNPYDNGLQIGPSPEGAGNLYAFPFKNMEEKFIGGASDADLLNTSMQGIWDPPAGKKAAYGIILLDEDGKILLRKPTGNFAGYHWTYAKGTPEPGETPFMTARKELEEETGYAPDDYEIMGILPKGYEGQYSSTYFYVAKTTKPPSKPTDAETEALTFAPIPGAQKKVGQNQYLLNAEEFINQTTSPAGVQRDLEILGDVESFLTGVEYMNADLTRTPANVDKWLGTGPLYNEVSFLLEKNVAFHKAIEAQKSSTTAAPKTTKETSPPVFTPTPKTGSGDINATQTKPGPAVIEYDHDESVFTKIGPKPGGGSSPGYLAESKNKAKYVIKEAATKAKDKTDFVRNEVLAQRLYSGIRERLAAYDMNAVSPTFMSPKSALVKPKTGTTPKISSEYSGVLESYSDFSGLTSSLETPQLDLADDFLACALLGIWDTQIDNVFMFPLSAGPKGPTGRLFRLDFGGSMNYRAQGKLKKAGEFGDTVDEVTNLFSSKYAGSKLYKYLDVDGEDFNNRLNAFAELVVNGTMDALLDQQVSLYGPIDPVARQALRNKLGARLNSMATWAEQTLQANKAKAAKAKPTKATPKAPAAKPAPSVVDKKYFQPIKYTLPDKVPTFAPELAEALIDNVVVEVLDKTVFNPQAQWLPNYQVKSTLVQTDSNNFPANFEPTLHRSRFTGESPGDNLSTLAEDLAMLSLNDELFEGMTLPDALERLRTFDKDIFDDMPKASDVAELMLFRGSPEARVIAEAILPLLQQNDALFAVTSKKAKLNPRFQEKIKTKNGTMAVKNVYVPLTSSKKGIDRPQGLVVIDIDNFSEAAVMHELIHAATMNSMTLAKKLVDGKVPVSAVPNGAELVKTYGEMLSLTKLVRKTAVAKFNSLNKTVHKYADSIGTKVTKKNRFALASLSLSKEQYEDYVISHFLKQKAVLGPNSYTVLPTELITYGMTDPRVQRFMAKIQVFGKKTAFTKFVDLVVGLVESGLKVAGVTLSPGQKKGVTNAFEATIQASENYLKAAAQFYTQGAAPPAATAGVASRSQVADAASQWRLMREDSPYFKAWMGNGLDGKPLPRIVTNPKDPKTAGMPGVYKLYHGFSYMGHGKGHVFFKDPKGFKPLDGKTTVRVFAQDDFGVAKSYMGGSKKKQNKHIKAGAGGYLEVYFRSEMPFRIHGDNESWSSIPVVINVESVRRNSTFLKGLKEYLELRAAGKSPTSAFNTAFVAKKRIVEGGSINNTNKFLDMLYKAGAKVESDPAVAGGLILVPNGTRDGEDVFKISPSKGTFSTDNYGGIATTFGFDAAWTTNVRDASHTGTVASNVVQMLKHQNIKASSNIGTFSETGGTFAVYPLESGFAGTAGVPDGQQMEAMLEYAEKGVDAPRFVNWFGDGAKGPDGKPELLFHGTAQSFDNFMAGSDTGAFGSSLYFTNKPGDASRNYASFTAPDILFKIEDVAGELQLDELDSIEIADAIDMHLRRDLFEGKQVEELTALRDQLRKPGPLPLEQLAAQEDLLRELVARARVTNNGQFAVMPVYASVKNPVMIDVSGNRGMTQFGPELLDVVDSSVEAADNGAQIRLAVQELLDEKGFVSAYELLTVVHMLGTRASTDLPEVMANGEVFRDIVAKLGYDGIIANAYDVFGDGATGPAANQWRRMQVTVTPEDVGVPRVTPDTYHYHAFDSEQVKSAFNEGTFNPSSPNIAQVSAPPAAPSGGAPGASLTNPEVKLLDDGSALLRAFENATLNDVVNAAATILRRDLSPQQQDELLDIINKRLGLGLTRKGADFVGDPADVAKADAFISDLLQAYITSPYARLPEDVKGLENIFADMQRDLTTAYRVLTARPGLNVQVTREVSSIFDPLLKDMPADESPLQLMMRVIFDQEEKPFEEIPNFLGDVVQEASRQGKTYKLSELEARVDNAIKNGTYDSTILELDKPLFPRIYQKQKPPPGGKYKYSLRDLNLIQAQYTDVPGRVIDPRRQFESPFLRGKDKQAVHETLYGIANRENSVFGGRVDKEAAKKKLISLLGPGENVRKYIGSTTPDALVDVLAKFTNIAALAMFGGRSNADISMLPKAMQMYIVAGVRMVEQAVGDTVRLTSEAQAGAFARGAAKAASRTRLYDYLSGQLVDFDGGRVALSSGSDKFGDLSDEVIEYVETFLSPAEQDALQQFADKVQPKTLGQQVIAPTPSSPAQTGGAFSDKDKFIEQVIQSIFTTSDKSGLQFFYDYHESIVSQSGSISKAEAYQAYEALLYHMGVTKREGRYVGGKADAPSGKSADRVRNFLEEIENASQVVSDKKKFGAHSNTSSYMRVATLIGAHGTARRTRQVWADQGVYIPAPVKAELARYQNGEAIPLDMLPEVQDTVNRFGMSRGLVEVQVLDQPYFIPRAARERLTDALARSVVKQPDAPGLLGRAVALATMTEDKLGQSLFTSYYRFLKKSIVRGSIFLKQRYFFMNTLDHFYQMATVVGYKPALVSTVRVAVNNVGVLPFMPLFTSLARVADDRAPEIMRRGIQKVGDRAAQAVAELIGASKWRLGVNEVLDGRDGFIRLGGAVYSYKELRDIAVAEGIFSSFDTSALRKNLRQAADLTLKESKLNSATQASVRSVSWYQNHIDDMAEAWSERERVGAMLSLIELGASPRSAARVTIDVLYDYAGTMTKADRSIWVNILFPFWAFQKNANRQTINALFSPRAAYRLNCLRRARETLPEAITDLMYESIVDEYGVVESYLAPDMQQQYSVMKNGLENGYAPNGDLSVISASTRRMLEKSFNVERLEDLPKKELDFVKYGYRGNMPAHVRQQIRLLFRNNYPVVGSPKLVADGQFTLLSDAVLEVVKGDPVIQAARAASIAPFDPSAKRTYNRDKSGIAFTPTPSPQSQMYYVLMGQVNPEHDYLEVLQPESSVEAAIRHVTGLAATLLLAGGAAFDIATVGIRRGASAAMGEESDLPSPAMDLWGESISNGLRSVVDIERAPLIQNVGRTVFSPKDPGMPIRVHPFLGQLFQNNTGLSMLKLRGDEDIYSAIEEGDITVEQAEEMLRAKAIIGPEAGLPKIYSELVDESDERVALLSSKYEQVEPELAQRIVDVADALEMNPDDLARVIKGESNFSPSQENLAGSGAMGLIQFMPSTARRLGTTTDALSVMSAPKQMEYVYQYLEPFKGRLNNYGDVAMAVYYPAAVGKPDDFSIEDHYYDLKFKQYSKNNDPYEARTLAQAATDKMVRQNAGITTRGDYLSRLGGGDNSLNLGKSDPDYLTFNEYDPNILPRRRGEGFKLKEDRYYMFPGQHSLLFQMTGIMELNRELMSELPIARTPLEKAGVGDDIVDFTVPGTDMKFSDFAGGPIALPTNRVGIALWLKTYLGAQLTEVSRPSTIRAEEPREQTTTVTPQGSKPKK